MASPKPLDVARIREISERLGTLLVEQPGAFDVYSTETGPIAPEHWWDFSEERVRQYDTVESVASLWPDQPLAGELGTMLWVANAAACFAERPSSLEMLRRQETDEARRAKESGGVSRKPASMRAFLDDRTERKADRLVRDAWAILKRAEVLYREVGEARLAANRAIYREDLVEKDQRKFFVKARKTEQLVLALNVFKDRHVLTVRGQWVVPRTLSEWTRFEGDLGVALAKLGVPKTRILQILSKDGADPEDERTRINRNMRRKRSTPSKPSAPTGSRPRKKTRGSTPSKARSRVTKRRKQNGK